MRTIETPYTGRMLLEFPLLNKGTAFTEEERTELRLHGLLPPLVESLGEQATRAYRAYLLKTDDLERHIYLRALQDANEVLFYRVLLDHLREMLPIVYTPVVGDAALRFSEIYRRPRGLFVSYPHRNDLDRILEHAVPPETEVIVVTDGERILGLGDQGAGGMSIPIGKLSLYTAMGGIDPAGTLPVLLDVGTNNAERLRDPLYIGWRHERIAGDAYYEFIDRFVEALQNRLPHVLLQFEDFSNDHARPLLDRYRDRICTFNDDIQGTAAVALGTVLAAIRTAGTPIRDQRVVVAGAGSAGTGISDLMIGAMVNEGLDADEAASRFWLLGSRGLLREGVPARPTQERFVRSRESLTGWEHGDDEPFGLADVVRNVRPTILVGVSGQAGIFDEPMVREMARHVERPIILPMSNPTSKSEGRPADLIGWTEGRALIGTGSPFDDVVHGGRRYRIAQSNNSYVFPGMGLGVLAAGAERVTDEMFTAAAVALSRCLPADSPAEDGLLPPLDRIREVSLTIAEAVGRQAIAQGLARTPESELTARLQQKMWEPTYARIARKR